MAVIKAINMPSNVRFRELTNVVLAAAIHFNLALVQWRAFVLCVEKVRGVCSRRKRS